MYSHDPMTGSNPVFPSQTKSNIESESEASRTASRFPPIKTKAQDTPSSLIKKNSDETTTNLKKGIIRKKGDKKKGKGPVIKSQIIQKYKGYTDFLTLVNLSNNFKIIVTEKVSPYVLYVGKGNNSSLIKQLFRNHRPWWIVEDFNPSSSQINLHWYQLRQNSILDDFKENLKGTADFQGCSYFVQDLQFKPDSVKQERQSDEKEEKSREGSRSTHKKSQQVRSHSVTHKQIRSTMKIGSMAKRSSSKPKGVAQDQNNMAALVGIGKNLKEQIEGEQMIKKKKVLANPKMWPVYTNYRRIFSHSELKQLKKLKIIQEDGKINCTLSRNKLRSLENRSNYIKMHNHVTNNWNVSNKKALFMNLKNYYEVQKINPFQYIPMTFHITGIEDKEFIKFQEEYERRAQVIKEDQKKKKTDQLKHGAFRAKKRNAWLVKPGQNTNRGTGIEVVESIDQIREIINREKTDKLGRPRTHIVQEYIMPFLYQKRKFDIRTYVLMTSVNGYQKVYWYQDGYLRTASKQFNMKNLNNKFIHLTNDAVQKYHQDYGKFQPGNKLSYADFQRYIDSVYNTTTDPNQKLRFFQQAYPEMKRLAADIFRSVYTKINPTKKQFSFEIFGLDYMVDQNFKIWLIECNTNPCLELSCPLLGRLIPTMLENAFKIAVDPMFPPPPLQQLVTSGKKIILPENILETNKFELIFDQVEEGKDLKSILSTTPEIKLVQVEEEDQEYDENGNECCQKHPKVEVITK